MVARQIRTGNPRLGVQNGCMGSIPIVVNFKSVVAASGHSYAIIPLVAKYEDLEMIQKLEQELNQVESILAANVSVAMQLDQLRNKRNKLIMEIEDELAKKDSGASGEGSQDSQEEDPTDDNMGGSGSSSEPESGS